MADKRGKKECLLGLGRIDKVRHALLRAKMRHSISEAVNPKPQTLNPKP